MRRGRTQQQDEQPQGAPAWMVTYSDMVTLLLAFFVLLFTFSSVDARKFETALLSMQGALGILHSGQTLTEDPILENHGRLENRIDLVQVLDLGQMEWVEGKLRESLRRAGLEHLVVLNLEERGLIIRFADSVLFDTGHAELRVEALEILEKIADVLADIPNHVRVEGHTDNVPIRTARFPSNWELSTTRATSVIRHLNEVHGLDPARLSAAGYGEYRPLAGNDTAGGRQLNRRVDVAIMYLSKTALEPR